MYQMISGDSNYFDPTTLPVKLENSIHAEGTKNGTHLGLKDSCKILNDFLTFITKTSYSVG